MSGAPQLADATWLKEGEVARLLSLLDRDGEAVAKRRRRLQVIDEFPEPSI